MKVSNSSRSNSSKINMRRIRGISKLSFFLACATAGVLAVTFPTTSAFAQNLVKNGNFTSLTSGYGQLGYNTNLTDWSVPNGSYNFVFAPGTIDKTGTTGQYNSLYMWGPNSGSNNGLTGIAPTGGNIVAADGAFGVGALSQTLTGLIVNQQYTVSFDWAGAQQHGYNGATTEQWQVTFGNQRKDTAVLQNPEHGFTGWRHEDFSFTANAATQTLSFLAAGTPSGEPPFSLLSGISVTAAPEPGSIVLLLAGGATGMLVVRKRKHR